MRSVELQEAETFPVITSFLHNLVMPELREYVHSTARDRNPGKSPSSPFSMSGDVCCILRFRLFPHRRVERLGELVVKVLGKAGRGKCM